MDSNAISTGLQRKPPRANARALLAAAAGLLLFFAGGASAADPTLLPPEQAFRFSARALDDRTLEARFAVADGYYLYRDKLKFAVTPAASDLAPAVLPAGKVKDDQFFGTVETYRGEVVVKLALGRGTAGQSLVLAADSQGCADLGVCYPPNQQKVTLVLPATGKGPSGIVEANPRKKSWFN